MRALRGGADVIRARRPRPEVTRLTLRSLSPQRRQEVTSTRAAACGSDAQLARGSRSPRRRWAGPGGAEGTPGALRGHREGSTGLSGFWRNPQDGAAAALAARGWQRSVRAPGGIFGSSGVGFRLGLGSRYATKRERLTGGRQRGVSSELRAWGVQQIQPRIVKFLLFIRFSKPRH